MNDAVRTAPVNVDTAAALGRALADEVGKVIVGKAGQTRLLTVALLADGHVLLDDVPGVAKTLLVRTAAAALSLGFSRVQCTPDLLPADVTGSLVYDQRAGEFVFRPGPLFANVVLADEINRATPRTQSAFLEAMEERGVTVDGVTHALPAPFLVLATQNPVELKGTFPLPEAQLDRFLLALRMGYPDADDEAVMLDRFRAEDPLAEVRPVVAPEQVAAARAAVRAVHVADDVARLRRGARARHARVAARAARREPAGLARAPARRPGVRRPRRARLRRPRRRAGARGARARPPAPARPRHRSRRGDGGLRRSGICCARCPSPRSPGSPAPPREAAGAVRLRSVLWVCLLGLAASAVLRSPALAFATLAALGHRGARHPGARQALPRRHLRALRLAPRRPVGRRPRGRAHHHQRQAAPARLAAAARPVAVRRRAAGVHAEPDLRPRPPGARPDGLRALVRAAAAPVPGALHGARRPPLRPGRGAGRRPLRHRRRGARAGRSSGRWSCCLACSTSPASPCCAGARSSRSRPSARSPSTPRRCAACARTAPAIPSGR